MSVVQSVFGRVVRMKPCARYLTLLAFVGLAALSASAQTAPAPAVFFTDLTGGPNTGGENVQGFSGSYVTLYGNNFGSSQGTSTVTWNGLNCLRAVSWGSSWLWYQKIVVQIGSSCTPGTGSFVVTVNGVTSTAVTENTGSGIQIPSQFTVTSTGHIRCVSNSGNNANPGTFSGGCWATIPFAKNTIGAGDIVYVENGVNQTAIDDYNASLAISTSGAAGGPKAIVAYPGATVTIGAANIGYGIRAPAIAATHSYWTFAGLNLIGADAIAPQNGVTSWRMVANTLQCPNGQGQDACTEGSQSTFLYYYGNSISNSGLNCPPSNCKQYHAFYMSTDTNDVWVGWNKINPNPNNTAVAGCRAIQFNSTPLGGGTGQNQFDIHIHDNFILNAICDGINLNTVDPDSGPVEVYNNVVWHVGSGPNPPIDQGSNYTCVNYWGGGITPVNPVLTYNNTFYDCGADNDGDASRDVGMFSLGIPVKMDNNIIYQSNTGKPYITGTTTPSSSKMTGSNNIWFGAGAKPSAIATTNDLNVDPRMTAPASGTFTLQATSPAIGAAITGKVSAYDSTGLIRPSPSSIGAYELTSGTAVQRPSPPTNLVVVVN